MNKYIKKIRNSLLSTIANQLGKSMALDLYKRLSERLEIESVTVSGESGRITGSPSELVMGIYVQNHHYDPAMVDLIAGRLLRNGTGTFIDIGANIGLITVPVAQDSKAAVHAFEPEPRNFEFLTNNITANLATGRVTLHNMALASSSEPLQFELSKDNFGDHRVRRESKISTQKFDEANRQVIEVAGERLDAALNADELLHPIVIKMDTQGAEAEVIKGGRQVFDVADYVLTEYCPYLLLRAGSDPSELIDFVRGFPFGAVLDGSDNTKFVLEPTERIIEAMQAFPQDGSAARHLDVLLARNDALKV
jgi:FkbM family methyltransferase